MQQRGVVTVLFDLKDDNKTVPFITAFRSRDGTKYVVDGIHFDGKGNVIAAKAVPVKTEPVPVALLSQPEVKPEPETTEAAMGI